MNGISSRVVEKSTQTMDELIDIFNRVKKYLNINDSFDKQWELADMDYDQNLYLFRYTNLADKTKYIMRQMEGLIFYIKDDSIKMIVRSYGYITELVSFKNNQEIYYGNELFDNSKNLIKDSKSMDKSKAYFYTNQKNPLALPRTNIEMKIDFEGLIIRVFYFNGKMFISTNKLIHDEKIEKLYYSLNGPTIKDLFDTDKQYSSYCYIFKIAELFGSKFLIYMDAKNIYSDDNKFEKKEIIINNNVDHIMKHLITKSKIKEIIGNVIIVPKLTIDDINKLRDTKFIIQDKRYHYYDSNKMIEIILDAGLGINIYLYDDNNNLIDLYTFKERKTLNREDERVTKLKDIIDLYNSNYFNENIKYIDLGSGKMEITKLISSTFKLKESYGVDVFEYQSLTDGPIYSQIKDRLDFNDNTFDLATCFVSIHHFEDLIKMLSELVRVSKDKSLLFIREHDVNSIEDVNYIEYYHLIDELVREQKGLDSDFFTRYFSHNNLKNILESFGYTELLYEKYPEPNPLTIYHSLFILNKKKFINYNKVKEYMNNTIKSKRPMIKQITGLDDRYYKIFNKKLSNSNWIKNKKLISKSFFENLLLNSNNDFDFVNNILTNLS